MNNKEKAQWLSDRWAEVAQGGVWKCCGKSTPHGPDMTQALHFWDVVMPPKLKVIDLLPLIISGIDCEVTNSLDGTSPWLIAELRGIDNQADFEQPYHTSLGVYTKCQPRMNHWHSWQGGDCPLPEGFVVRMMFRCAALYDGLTTDYPWIHRGKDHDIIAFRVLRVADGYCMPWEVES